MLPDTYSKKVGAHDKYFSLKVFININALSLIIQLLNNKGCNNRVTNNRKI